MRTFLNASTLVLILLPLALIGCGETAVDSCEGDECVTPNPDDFCAGVDCSGHGECFQNSEGAICICDEGYYPEDLSCVENPGSCDGVDCSGHGECFEGSESARAFCICDPGYFVRDLECIGPCDGIDCSGHGECVAVGGYTPICDCDDDYYVRGLECLLNSCEGVDCSGHGDCSTSSFGPSCDCDSGYVVDGLECILDDIDSCGFEAADSSDYRLSGLTLEFPPLGPNCTSGLTGIAEDLINDAICSDSDDPADGELDLTVIMLAGAAPGAIGPANCDDPAPGTGPVDCSYATVGQDGVQAAESLTLSSTDPCEATIGTTTVSVPAGENGCWKMFVGEFTLFLGTVSIPLFDFQVLAADNGANGLGPATMLGAITVEDADNTLIPEDVPAVGGQPLGDLLCEDDAQMIDGTPTYVFEVGFLASGVNATNETPL